MAIVARSTGRAQTWRMRGMIRHLNELYTNHYRLSRTFVNRNEFKSTVYDTPHSRYKPTHPAHDLCCAVLLLAIEDITNATPSSRSNAERQPYSNQRQAYLWIMAPSKHPFSFLFICEHLGISSSAFRGEIESLYQRHRVDAPTLKKKGRIQA